MHGRGVAAVSATCALALSVAACGGGSSTAAGGGSGTIKLGVLTSLSGPASSAFTSTISGIKARLAAYKEDGGKCAKTPIDLVQADDQSNPAGNLTGMQKLIKQDKVYSVLEITSFFYAASQFATTTGKGTPIIGGAIDGAKQWQDAKNNLFPALPVPDLTKTYSTIGEYFKRVGGTKVAGVGYNSPSAQAALEGSIKSSEVAGLKRGYVNNSVAFGSTDVGPIVLGIIASKADVINMTMAPSTSFAVVAGLRQAGYKTKAILSATGYGADLLNSAPAVQIGQNVTFSTGWAPSELKTTGTERMAKALKEHTESKAGIPGFGQALGWLEADLFLHGLDLAGCNASQAKYLSTLRADKTWDANGLYPEPHDFTKVSLNQLCLYFLRLKGTGFVPEPNAMPICGSTVG